MRRDENLRFRYHLLTMLRPSLAVLALMGWLGASAQGADATSVAAVLDTSGSMRDADIACMRQAVSGLLANLGPGSELALFTFDDQARLLLPRTSDAEQVRKTVAALGRKGRYTVLHDALYEASRYLRNVPAGRKAVLLITDGKDENSDLNLEDGLKAAQEVHLPIIAVGVGEAQEKVLRRVARLSGGRYFRPAEASPADLAQAIRGSAEAVALAHPPAAVVSPAAPPGHTPLSAATPLSPPSRPGTALSGKRLLGSLLGLLGVVGIVLAIWLLRRLGRRRCPTCGTELTGALGQCPICVPEVTPPVKKKRAPHLQAPASALSAEPTRKLDASVLSETVLARLNETEEFLEKTVTLRERPALTITGGRQAGQVFPLSGETTTSLGRARANDIMVDDIAVSSQHCRICPDGERFELHDLASTNGTFVNEQRIARQVLNEGDVIRIGETQLQFHHTQLRT